MINIEAWLGAHPALVTLILWPAVTAFVNTVWQDASVYADTHPRFAPFKKIVQKIGLSPRGIVDLIVRTAKAQGLPTPPTPPPQDSGSFGALTGTIPPPGKV